MRRFSVLFACAALVLAGLVTYTYVRRAEKERGHESKPPERLDDRYDATASAWHWGKDDPRTNCPIVRAEASSFIALHDPSLFQLENVKLRLYNNGCSSYTYVQSGKAEFNTASGLMTSAGDVSIIMKIPSERSPDAKENSDLIHIRSKGVKYETKTGKVDTDQPAAFQFAHGNGTSIGADYDPTTHLLHMKSQVALNWFGKGPPENAMHISAGDVVYDEINGKVYLTPWSKLQRGSTTILGGKSEVTLIDGILHEVDTANASGTDEEESRHVTFGADKLVALFNDDGDMTEMTGESNARLSSTNDASKTVVTSHRAELHFDITSKTANGQERHDSILHEAFAKGNAVVESIPLPQPGVQLADTRILRSQAIELTMRPGGRDIESMRTDTAGQIEFKPNRAGAVHRTLDADNIRIVYGEANALESFHGIHARTRTDKPATGEKIDGKPVPAPPPSFTWSDELLAKFAPKTNQMATLEQNGHFRYEEGLRHATAHKAFLEQTINKITLTTGAKVWDNTGSTSADVIVLNQQSGDMDASGHVASTREPDQQNDAQNSSMLDKNKPLQARADKMETRDNNLKIHYQGHAILWQGANRLQADVVDIDRDAETLHAVGNVVSELVDKQDDRDADTPPALEKVANTPNAAPNKKKKDGPAIFTIVHAPELLYNDDDRLAHYTGGVKLVRDNITMTSKELRAYLTPEDDKKSGANKNDSGSSLDHAIADGDVMLVEAADGRTKTGTAQHCEYYPNQDKAVLTGGKPKVVDSRKGVTVGAKLTYYSKGDRLLVEGGPKSPVVSDLLK
jgi:lipopolysaccharide export system protein LptA